MNQIKIILVPTDFSIPADYALYYAVELAKVYDSSIILYHSFIPFESGFYPIAQSKKENEENENNLINRLTKIKNEILKSNKDCSISVRVNRGPESLNLVAFCKKKQGRFSSNGNNRSKRIKRGYYRKLHSKHNDCSSLSCIGNSKRM